MARGGSVHIIPVLRQLHWLPVRQRIRFKIAEIIEALTGQAPAYLADDCRLISDSDRRKLRSSDIRTCVTSRTSTRFGDRSFSAAGPQIWNGLPPALRAPDLTFNRFKRGLKTFTITGPDRTYHASRFITSDNLEFRVDYNAICCT